MVESKAHGTSMRVKVYHGQFSKDDDILGSSPSIYNSPNLLNAPLKNSCYNSPANK